MPTVLDRIASRDIVLYLSKSTVVRATRTSTCPTYLLRWCASQYMEYRLVSTQIAFFCGANGVTLDGRLRGSMHTFLP